MLEPYSFDTGVSTGGAGASTATSPAKMVVGRVCALGFTFSDTPPATTDVIVRTRGKHGPVRTLITLTNVNTDGWYELQHATQDNVGADVFWENPAIADELEVVASQMNDGDSVQVVALVDR